MLQVDMAAKERQTFGKGAARSMRRDGKTPAVLYGEKNEAKALALDTASFRKSLMKIHRRNAVVTLELEGVDGSKSTHSVIVKEIQKDPVVDSLIHVDFQEISLSKERVYGLQVDYVGEAKGVDLGGFMNIIHPTVSVIGLPMDIPDSIEVNVADLDIGDHVTCKDLPIPKEVKLLDDESAVCVAISHPKGADEEEEAGEEGAEEEVAAAGDESKEAEA